MTDTSAATGPFETEREAHAFALKFGGPPGEGWSILSADQNRQMLTRACEIAGVQLGAFDRPILGWLAKWEDDVCAAISAMIMRAGRGLTEDQWFQVREAREAVARWASDRDIADPGYDTEKILADHLRTVLALIPEGE
jgi:hypothetical protein